MTFQDAVNVIRKELPNRLIWYGFEYKGAYVFAIAPDMEYLPGETAMTWFSVDKKTGVVESFDYYGRSLFDGEYAILEAAKSRIPVDITREQLDV